MRSNLQHAAKAKKVQRSVATTGRKAPGTRIGLLMDWRDGSAKSGRLSGGYGRSLRVGK
jgi:hypothetical protein